VWVIIRTVPFLAGLTRRFLSSQENPRVLPVVVGRVYTSSVVSVASQCVMPT
jgi:hypothetical protein